VVIIGALFTSAVHRRNDPLLAWDGRWNRHAAGWAKGGLMYDYTLGRENDWWGGILRPRAWQLLFR
jgi:hypothetical protein